MQRWRLDLEYHGADFAGWQVQPGQRTVQGVLGEAITTFTGESVVLRGAGRTDAGVHAWQQIAVFDAEVDRPARAWVGGLNHLLPADVAVVQARPVAADFDPRHAPHTKRYEYRWLCRRAPSPLREDRLWRLPHELDVEAMHRAALAVVGRHDFSSFRAVGCSSTHALRTVRHVELERVGDEVCLGIHGTGFLRHMVRILAGSLTEIGAGRRDVAWLGEVIAARERTAAGPTAPARGLCLRWIRFDEEP